MRYFIFKNSSTQPRTRILQIWFLLPFFIACLLCLASCQQKIDYFQYVSELRSNIFLAKNENFSLRIYSVQKESPYAADGIPQETYHRTEIYLLADAADQPIHISFPVGQERIQGDMSYDNVKGEYYIYFPIDVSAFSVLECDIEYQNTVTPLQAISVVQKDTLSCKAVLNALIQTEKNLFTSMTDKYGFTGEIYLRLIYEDSPYYYIGIIERNGTIHAFLLHAQTGKILAKRES